MKDVTVTTLVTRATLAVKSGVISEHFLVTKGVYSESAYWSELIDRKRIENMGELVCC